MTIESQKLVDSKRSWFLLSVAFLSLFGVGGLQMSFGTILAALVREFGESKSKTAWVGCLVTFFKSVLSPLAIFLSRRHGIRITQFIGGIFLTIGVITTSIVRSVDYMFLTYGVLVGIGAALISSPVFASIPELFDKYVSIAMGITNSGNTLGLVFFSFVLPTLLSELGWRETLWMVAALGPLISICSFALPKTLIQPECDETIKEKEDRQIAAVESEPWWKCIKKKAFVLWCTVVFTYGLVEYVPLYLMAICAQESGIPATRTKWLNIIYGVGCLVGKLLSGSLAKPLLKRDRSKYLYLAAIFTHTVCSFLASLSTEFQWLAVYMAVVGFLQGTTSSLFYIVTLEIVGIANFPTVCGFLIGTGAVSWTSGPPLAGMLYETLPQVHYLLLAVSATCFLATVAMVIIPCVTPRRNYTLHQGDYDYWRVYCHNPNMSPRPPRQNRAFTVEDGKNEMQEKSRSLKKGVPGRTVSTTHLVEAEEVQLAI